MGTVILAQGFDSGPDARKTTAMGEVATDMGWSFVHVDWIASQFGLYPDELADCSTR